MSDQEPKHCVVSSESDWRMPPQSRFAGQRIDASSRRSIRILAEDTLSAETVPPANQKFTIGSVTRSTTNQIVVDFFYHEGEFFRAVIPLDAVDNIYGQTFNFSKAKTRQGPDGPEILRDRRGLPRPTVPMLTHVQSRFTLQPGRAIELYRIDGACQSEVAHRVSDFIYSLEVMGPAGSRFNLRDGLLGNFLSAHRFLSTQEMVFERLVMESQTIAESAPLPLDESEKRDLLWESLLRSDHAAMSERYYLFRLFGTNNCTSGPFKILDKVVRYNWLQWIGAQLYRLPLNPRFYLWVRGLDSDPSFRKLVGPEFEDYLQDPRTERRKQERMRQLEQPT